MFDKLLSEAVTEAEGITEAIGVDGAEVQLDHQLIEYVQAAKVLVSDPEYIGRLRIELSGDKTGRKK